MPVAGERAMRRLSCPLMRPVLAIHVAVAVALLALATGVGVWGIVRARPGSPIPAQRSELRFLRLVAWVQSAVFAVGLTGLLLLGRSRPDDPLHAKVYGPFMVVAIVASIAYRSDDGRFNSRLYGIVALVIAALGVRAATTG